MRSPSEYIAAAVAGLRSRMPESTGTLTRDGVSAPVTVASPTMRGEDELNGDTPSEFMRVIALASDLPFISKGDIVEMVDLRSSSPIPHIVTSVRTDCAAASSYIGLSQPLSRRTASVSGVRASRHILFPLDIFALDNGLAQDMTDGFAPTTVHVWTICFPVDSWPSSDTPQIGDELRFDKDGQDVLVKVTRCDRRSRRYIISARSR